MSKVITFISEWNSSGKTTMIVNLSCWLSLLGKKVLVIDLDPKGEASSNLGINNFENFIDIKEILINNLSLDSGIIETTIKDLFIIPYNKEKSEELSILTDYFAEDISLLREAVDLLESKFDYIFIDVPPIDSIITRAVLVSTDSVIITLKSQTEELDSIPNLTDLIIDVKNNENKFIELQGIVINLYTESSFSRNFINKIKEKFGNLVFKTIIPKNATVSEANNRNKPVVLYDMKSFGADSYLRFAKEFMQYHEINV